MMNLFSKPPKFTGNYLNNSVGYENAPKTGIWFLAEAKNAWIGLWNTIMEFFKSYQWKEILFGIKVGLFIFSLLLLLAIILVLLKIITLNSLAKPASNLKSIVFDKKKMARKWAKIEKKLNTGAEANYKLAILEADNFFDEIIKSVGYEKEKSLSNIIEIKMARKIKNNIIEDSGFLLTYEDTKNFLAAYKVGLEELGAL